MLHLDQWPYILCIFELAFVLLIKRYVVDTSKNRLNETIFEVHTTYFLSGNKELFEPIL